MKKTLALLLAATLCLTGCGTSPRVPATVEQFVAAAHALEWDTVDLTPGYTEQLYVASVIMATKTLGEVDFFVLISDEFALAVYESNLENLQQLATGKATRGADSDENYKRYWVKTEKDYWMVILLGETVVFGHVPINYAEDLDNLIERLGY